MDLKVEELLTEFFGSDNPERHYFGDLINKETGKSARQYIQTKTMNIARENIRPE